MIGTSASQSGLTFATMSDGTSRSGPESTMSLIQRVHAGDDQALNDLCARYLPRLERWARGRLPASARGTSDTQDLAQLTITQIARHVHRFVPQHEGAFQAYVRRALLNQIRSQIRSAGRRPPPDPLEDEHQSPDASPLEQAIGRQLLDRYDEALDRLKPSDREAIIARVEMGLSWSEAAEVLGKNTPGAAQMTVSRALVRLAKEMGE